jgi:ABC-2 type transport system permease protein
MKRNRMWVIARHEWRATVMRREFLMVTIGLPLFICAIVVCTSVLGALTIAKAVRKSSTNNKPVGIYDPTHVLAPSAYKAPIDGTSYQIVASLDSGRQAVGNGSLRALVVVPQDYLSTGHTELYRRPSSGIFDNGNQYQYDNALRAGLAQGRLPQSTAARLLHPQMANGPKVYEWNSATGAFKPAGADGAGKDLAKFAVPYAFSMLLMMSILTGTGYLLHGLVEEKENRVMEILLSSVSHEEILRGKLLGLGAAGLTQLGVWAVFGGIPAGIALSLVPSAPHIPAFTLIMAAVLFMLGFGLYGSIMAGVGSVGTSWRESQQATAAISMCAVIPLMLITVFLAEPNGAIARTLSWFPPTAPISMMLRVAMGSVPWWDIGLSIASLGVGIWVVQKISVKLFRLGLLLYGKAPNAVEVWRWLVQA